MVKPVLFLIAATLFFSCKKNSSGTSTRAPDLKSVNIYYPICHCGNTQTFTYSGTQLTQYTSELYDSSYDSLIAQEIMVYTFQYLTSATLPYSASLQIPVPQYFIPPATYFFQFDKQNRLIEDSTNDQIYNSYVYYAYTGDSVTFKDSLFSSGAYLNSGVNDVNGNLTSLLGYTVTYGSAPNPLYDPAIGNTFGTYFIAGLLSSYPNDKALPLDFISQNLPVSWNPNNGNPMATFSWTTGQDGRVTGGTAINALWSYAGITDTARITFTYQ